MFTALHKKTAISQKLSYNFYKIPSFTTTLYFERKKKKRSISPQHQVFSTDHRPPLWGDRLRDAPCGRLDRLVSHQLLKLTGMPCVCVCVTLPPPACWWPLLKDKSTSQVQSEQDSCCSLGPRTYTCWSGRTPIKTVSALGHFCLLTSFFLLCPSGSKMEDIKCYVKHFVYRRAEEEERPMWVNGEKGPKAWNDGAIRHEAWDMPNEEFTSSQLRWLMYQVGDKWGQVFSMLTPRSCDSTEHCAAQAA